MYAPTFYVSVARPDGSLQIRVYYLDSQYFIQEYCYSKNRNGWHQGTFFVSAKIKASPVTRLSAITWHDGGRRHIRVYYQGECGPSLVHHLSLTLPEGPGSRTLRELSYNDGWSDGEIKDISDAVEGTGIAAVTYHAGAFQIRIYYQTFGGLCLKEYCFNHHKKWHEGKFLLPVYAIHTTYGIFRPIPVWKGAAWSYDLCYRQ
jgi:hypothetical protein